MNHLQNPVWPGLDHPRDHHDVIAGGRDLVANTAVIQNVIDLARAVRDLQADGYFVHREDLAWLSPYQPQRLTRFGDYTLSMSSTDPFDTDLVVPFPLEDAQESAATA